MKYKKINELNDLEELYKEKIKVLEKLHKASESMAFLAERYWFIKRSSNQKFDYLAQIDKRIGELEKNRFKRNI